VDHRALIAHLPRDRAASLATGEPLPEEAHGAALFADLAGFTPLTHALALALGPRRGAEALTHHLSVVYERLIGAVHEHGGTVVDFSGDAVMCWFDDARPAGAEPGPDRAVACGLALHQAVGVVGALTMPDGSRAALAVKVAVATGPVRRFVVGDPAVQVIDVVAGATVARVADGERAARPDEVVVDAATATHLGTGATLGPLRTGPEGGAFAPVASLARPVAPSPWPDLPAGRPAIEALRPWIDAAVRDLAEERVTELRPTVALFVGLGAVDVDADPASVAVLDRRVRRVQAALVRHGGTLVQVTMGDKGSYVYAAFGAPVAHEDLADRAVACAVELREAGEEADAAAGAWAFGLDQGVARTGAYGAADRRTYGVIGDATNRAAGLMVTARPGEILASAAVHRACRRAVSVEAAPPWRPKGGGDPVEVVRITQRPLVGGAGRAFGALVGRTAELHRLVDALDAVRRGPAGTIVIAGEAGVGKSHLVDAARRSLLARAEVTWLATAADDTRRSSLQAFLPVLRDLFFQDLTDDPAARRLLFDEGLDDRVAALEATGDPAAAATAAELRADESYLAALLGHRRAGSPYERHEPATRFERSLRAIDTLLRAESLRRPVVVHVRDAHWLDDDSIRVVARLAETATKHDLALLLDQRTIGDDRAGAAPVTPTHHLVLGPLPTADVSALAAVLLGGRVAPALVDHLVERTLGNALFVEQLVLHLRDDGLVEPGDDGWTAAAADPGGGALPVTLSAVLVARLDRLGESLRTAVQAAAVLGEAFEPGALAALLADDEAAGDAAPDALVAVDALVADGEAIGIWHRRDDGLVGFRHALVRDAAYDVQLDARLRARHRRAAAVLAAQGGRRTVSQAVALAHHEERAGRPRRAAAHLRRAGSLATEQFAYRDACGHLTRALALATAVDLDRDTRSRLHERLGDAAHVVGDYDRAVVHLRAAVETAGGRPPSVTVGLWTRIGEALERTGRDDEAAAAFESALAVLQDAPDLATASRIYAGLALVHGRRGELDAAVELAEVALGFAAGDDALVARAHQVLCVLEEKRGRLAAAAEHGRACLAGWEALGSRPGIAAAHNNLGLVHAASGDVDEAVAAFRVAVAGFEAIGHEHGLARALDNLAGQLVRAGDDAGAMACLEQAVAILARIGLDERGVVAAGWEGGGW
jgi:class 3 adenylate cyclase/tetratricopeptide (TPR) repeat protein